MATKRAIVITWMIFCWIHVIIAKMYHVNYDRKPSDWSYYDYDYDTEKGLFPSVFNLATNSIIIANATCGENSSELYCKLVEHVSMREPQCSICDARSDFPDYRHPIINAIDGTNRWWQSPTLQNGKNFEWVTITLDLKQIFQVAYVIVKTAISPRPGNWILERSRDGRFYKPWQFYAISDAECWEAYGIPPTVGQPRYRSDDEIICTSYYSKLNPLENAEIHTSLVNGRPGAEGPSDALREFTTARYVRLRLQKIRTLNADLMTLQTDDPRKIDKSTTRRYFYSIKDISIGGQCVCHGHASLCPVDFETNLLRCKCEHNTCGENCEQCCPLYQQKPWKPGTNNDGAICEKCQCFGHTEICFYDQTVADKKASLNINGEYDGGGVCIKCRNHTTGINCEQCEDGYYRPIGVGREDPNPCRRCKCAGPGVTGFCFKDDSFIRDGVQPGDCICKLGFAGSQCDRCASGYKNFPNCEPCPCNIAGTKGGTACEGSCICKNNVEGVRCDVCKANHYNLDPQNPDGCTPCYCSGITDQCQSSDWRVKVISNLKGWKISDLYGTHVVYPTVEEALALMISDNDMNRRDVYYWSAPPEYLGKKLYSYGGELRYVVSYSVTGEDSRIAQIKTPGVLIEGDNTRIGHYFGTHHQIEGNISVALPLQERVWFLITAAGKRGKPVSRIDFSRIINNITRLLIRAKYHPDQTMGILYNAEIEIASYESTSIKVMTSVEKCTCPLGYAGLSCEVCEHGYRRVNNVLHKGVCELCMCNNHAHSCDPYTGYCEDCLHNTTGLFCQQCKYGFHGDPVRGTTEDCKLCACPLENPENNFSPDCNDVTLPDGSVDYICTWCDQGYTGNKCERCDTGYYGQPSVPGGYCQLCDCTGNEDINDPNFCDHITGDCLKCINNTRGLHCEECLEGHYGSAYKHSCKPCECSPVGSKSSMCDPENGGCDCKENYEGKNCDRCIIGYGNIEQNCVPCDCNMTGSIRKLCDSVSGKCVCKPGIGGLQCDSCLEGFYSYSDTGCKSCECNIMGSISRKCDGYGNCTCKPYVKGQKCNGCYPGYWNLLSGNGCQECNCHPIGSLSSVCDIHEGNCSCRPGVEAPKCDHCKRGFYGFSEDGCKKCRSCKEGRVCDPETGECVCPPYTTGRLCERCVEASFGHDPIRGCQPCDCSEKGSPKGHNKCDVVNGNCLCLEGFEGRRCDKCRFAHYNFPTCIRCECRYDGTEPSKCSAEGLCQCDESGSCTCKVNVIGKKCDKCKPATFGMSLENPKGCFDCFCFNRSKTCDQAKMMWSLLKAPVREAHFEFGKTPMSSLYNFTLIPGRTGNVKIGIPLIIKQPVYWMLPREFIGEKIRSYNGILQFRIESRSSEQFPDPLLLKYPLVILEGFPNLVLVHTLFLPTSKGHYSVRFHEDEWRQWQNPDIVINRAIMMTALRNVQNILIRATEGGSVTIARISDISMEVAVPISPIPASPYVAVGVEKCTCPKEYSGTSCQDPGRGFYRKFKPNFNESEDIIDFIGFAAPCPCKNRSETCDPETGHCYNCRENTAGAFCERCAKGFFGNPDIAACKPCACPLPTNSFSDTCEGDSNDHNCTNCQDGYEGKNCERCMIGFYGNPMIPGDSCKPCNCNSYGSFSRICDRMTGQCQCRKGISGRDCTYCQPRYVLTDLGCKSCDDDCTRPLLDDAFYLIEMAEKANISNLILPPWIPLLSFDDQITQLKSSIARYHSDLANALNISQSFMLHYDYESLADFMHLRGRDINIKAGPLAFDALEIKEDAEAFIKHVEKLWKRIYGTVTLLQQENKNLTFSAKAIDAKIKIAERFLKEIKQKDLPDQREEAERELRKVIGIMDQVRQAIMDYELFLDKQSQLNRLTHILSETIRLIERSVKRKNTETSMKVSEEKQREERIYSQILMSSEMHSTANISLVDANDLLAAGEELMNNATIIFEKLPPVQERLENGTEQLEHRRGILARLNPRYIQKFVIPAKDHAAYLSEQAMYLSNMFRATNIAAQSSLQAAQIYDKIIDLIDLAEQVAIMTSNTADRVAYEAQPSSSFTPLSRQAFLVKRSSIDLREEAIQFMLDAQALQEALNQKKLVLNKLAIDIANGTSVISHINENVNLSRNIGDKLHDIEEEHKRTIQTLDIVHHNVTTLSLNIDSRLYSELDQIRLGSSAGLSIINKHIDEGKSIMTAAIDKANAAEKRVEKVKNLNQDMQTSLKNLKNKILLARQKSSNIRVSLGANKAGICVRSYRPEIEPTTTTNIILNYAISSNDRDSLLFFLASSVTKDFMIIEMVNRKIRFLWNAGGGTQVIQHNLTIESNDEQMLRNERWYKIEVKRFGNVATLSVKSTPDGQKADPHEVTDASPVGYSQMDLDSNSFFYIGGTPKGYRVPRELKARNFAGCLYEVILDGKKVGLWNFLTSQGCSGCKEGATEEADFSAYNFKGDGYAILPQIRRYKKTSYVVTLRFKTFDEDALIFFSPNLENGDFVSLELRNGHLVYQFNLGSQSRSMLKTSKKYNTGNWTLLSAVRDKLQGQLSVDDEFLEGQLPARGPIKMELQKSLMYFGGVPPNFTNTVWNGITFQKFLGCMKDLQIDSTPLNLLKNGFFSVEPSCTETPIRSVSFRGNGYLEIASHPLLLETSFGFSFHSLQSEAILLLSTFEIGRNGESNKKDFYSVAIVEGHLEARFSGSHGVASVSNSSVKVNDGIYHTVTFLKRHRRLMMRIDDKEVGSSRLPKGSKDIDAPMQRGLFLGGIREGIIPGRMIATKEFLTGTIKDLIFDNELLHFNQPVDFKGAGIGRTLKQWVTVEPPYTGVTQPLERCAEMASYLTEKSASNFGDSLFSYAKMAIGRKSFEFDFNVTLDIRTYYPNGLIVLVRNGGSVSHLAIMLLDGRIAVDVFDRKARHLASEVPLSDGDWHHISITKLGRRIQMKIDKHKKITLKVRRRLGVDSPMYVGGVPENFKPIEKVVFESFKGCIREFHLNGKYLDLARGELHFVNSCFSTIERGAYFNGDAYATYDDKFDLGIKLDVQMEFKTTRPNGVLLSLTAESGLPSLALELVNGSVIVTVALSEEDKPFSAKRSFQSKYEMCDGQWHMVTTQYAHKAVTLKIDMYEVSYGLSENIPLEPQTSDPLYIAGLPDDAPTGAHNIRDNFVGCLKNIAINDRRVNWMDMPARHNVQPNSCPTF